MAHSCFQKRLHTLFLLEAIPAYLILRTETIVFPDINQHLRPPVYIDYDIGSIK
jgi:hypothetical protein